MHSLFARLRLSTLIALLCSIALPLALTGTTLAPVANAATMNVAQSVGTIQFPEIPRGLPADANEGSTSEPAQGPAVNSANLSTAHGNLGTSFNGLTLRQQRLANGGNQFTVEPPDQGLCVGNGYVLESVNDVLNVYSTSGKSLLGVTALNTFYHYPPAINRTTHVYGPFVTDPSCYFDQATQRWFHVVLTLDTVPASGDFTGTNHLDLAVSQSANPLGAWNIYRIAAQDDGTQGTPNHACPPGPPSSAPPANPNACLGDYPHIGADAYGFYITTNEYPFFGDGYHAAQIYAFSKKALAAGVSNPSYVQLDTIGLVNGNPGFTVWPATSPDNQFAYGHGGTEYFLSSNAAAEANGNGVSSDLIVWSLTNTKSLESSHPSISLSNTIVKVNPYGIPPLSDQKAGPTPLADCLNTTQCATLLLGGADPYHEVEGQLDSNDTRMQQVTFANGKLWGALDTIVTVGGVNKAGIEWFIVNPFIKQDKVQASIIKQGYLGRANTNLNYPAIGVTKDGKGVMAFTLVGANDYPSAAYATIDAQHGVGDIHIAAAGVGPQDGFSEYKAFSSSGVPRPRWGDYGAAVPVGHSVWIASEYIGQSCSFHEYVDNYDPAKFGTCDGTRVPLGNWYTRISRVDAW